MLHTIIREFINKIKEVINEQTYQTRCTLVEVPDSQLHQKNLSGLEAFVQTLPVVAKNRMLKLIYIKGMMIFD